MRSDAALMRAARNDPAAFRELYERYAARIYAFNLARTADADAAFDLTAETFAQAWLVRRRFRDERERLSRPVALRDRAASRSRSPSGAGGSSSRACERLGHSRPARRAPATVEPDDAGSRASTRRSPICRRASVPPSNCV